MCACACVRVRVSVCVCLCVCVWKVHVCGRCEIRDGFEVCGKCEVWVEGGLVC